MKKIIGAALVAVGMLAVGCGDSTKLNQVGSNEPNGGGEHSAPVIHPFGAATNAQALEVEVRMRGTGAESFSSLVLMANRLEAFADGKPIAVTPTWRAVDLANMQHAEKIGSLSVPAGTKNVEFRVELGAAGGFETADSAGWVDSRQSVIHWSSPVAQLSKEGRSVVAVDAKRSFVKRDADEMVFVPQFRIY